MRAAGPWQAQAVLLVPGRHNGARAELAGTGPGRMCIQHFSDENGDYWPAALLGRYRRMSSKYNVPEPPAVVVLPFVPTPIAMLSTLVSFTP